MCDMTISPQEMHKALSDEIWGPEELPVAGSRTSHIWSFVDVLARMPKLNVGF